MAIKEFITLEGVQEVEAQLKKLAASGEQSLEQFRKPLPDMKLPEIDAKPIQEFTDQTIKLKDALHVLHPILQAAGVQIGELGAFARLASGSVVGLGAAFGGAVLIGLAKLDETTQKTKGQLTDLFGSSAKGEQAFTALAKQAMQFGTTVGALAPGLEAFQTALNNVDRTAKGFVALKAEDLPGASLAKNVGSVTAAFENFIKLLRAGRLSLDEAEKTAESFFTALKQGGAVSKAALQSLPVGTLQLLKEALGAAGLTTKAFFEALDSGRITLDQLQSALANFGPQAERAFQTKAVKSFSDEFGKIMATLAEGFQKLSGGKGFSDFVLGELKRIREGIGSTLKDIDNLVALFKFLQSFGKPQFEASVGAVQKAIMDSLVKPQQGFDEAGFEDLGKTAAKAFGLGWINAPEPKQALSDINKTFRDAPALKEPIKLPPIDKTDFQKSLDDLSGLSTQAGTQAGQNVNTGFQASIPENLTLFQAFYQQLVSLFATPIPVKLQGQFTGPLGTFTGVGAGEFLASGGMVRGAGTATSDSILAFLSNREFVVNARAVSHYGPDLFAALNAMRLPRDFLSRFSMGGLARSLGGNRFAAGGQVRSGNPVVLKIDRQSFNMTAGDDTITQLKRFAVTAQLSSTGRKPRWVR